MCDIWKGNKNLKQLSEKDVQGLLTSLKKLDTKQVLMSGGEALLHPAFFDLCRLLKKQNIQIALLSTGLTLKRNAEEILDCVDELIISLDGDEETHDAIRNIDGAFSKLKEGIASIKSIEPDFRITARTVIHKLNFKKWPAIIDTAAKIGLDQISFLPADISSHAFNREVVWTEQRQADVLVPQEDLAEFKAVLDLVIGDYKVRYPAFIAESSEKLNKIYLHYCATHGLCDFPDKKCNAPWVSTVIEPDGTVRPCFFHPAIGTIKDNTLPEILNGKTGMKFRKELNLNEDETCKRCVCYLNLSARHNPVQ